VSAKVFLGDLLGSYVCVSALIMTMYFSSLILSTCVHSPQVDKIKLEKYLGQNGTPWEHSIHTVYIIYYNIVYLLYNI